MHTQSHHLPTGAQRQPQTNGSRPAAGPTAAAHLPVQVMPMVDPSRAAGAKPLSAYTDHPEVVVLAHLIWHVLPAALEAAPTLIDRGLAADCHRNAPDREAAVGMTLIRKTDTTATPIHELLAWVSVRSDSENGPPQHLVFHHVTSDVAHRNGAVIGAFDITTAPAAPNTVAITVEQDGKRVLALTRTVTPDGRTVNWAASDLPRRLNLGGGQYELYDMQVHPTLLA